MTEAEKREHALRIAREVLLTTDFSWVTEDEELEDASEDDMLDIYNMIYFEGRVVL